MSTSNKYAADEIARVEAAYAAADVILAAADTTLAGRCTALEAIKQMRYSATNLPAAAAGNSGWVVLYTGSTDTYTQYHFYISTGSAWTDLGSLST